MALLGLILNWLALGLTVTVLARLVYSARTPELGLPATTALGMMGCIVGGLVGNLWTGRPILGLDPASLFGSIVGATAVLLVLGLRPMTVRTRRSRS